MKSIDTVVLYKNTDEYMNKKIKMDGWIKNHRKQKEFGFIDFYDGTCLKSVQIVYKNELDNFNEIQKLRVGSSISIQGIVEESPAKGQRFEVNLISLELLGDSPENYPIQPKRHSREFLREVGYLRPRVSLFQAVFRVRSIVAKAIHDYFNNNGYVYVHTPLLTASDCEGAGEMFQVTTLDLNNIPKNEDGEINFKKDFFGKPANLTVSGQLQAEAFALAFKKVYTFGPTFRAENSNTKTHANEFWMIEPEISFCELPELMEIQEEMLKFIIQEVVEKCPDELEFFDNFVEKGIIDKLNKVIHSNAVKITHKEAIDILINCGEKFEFKPEHGEDLATEHEKYLTTEHFKSPVFVTDWPKDIKAFYMRQNIDGTTVAAVDLLVPGSGELMGGSQREERLEILEKRMSEMDIDKEHMEWYINLRKFGGCKHSGFGMGFERLLMYVTGIENIRDVIPFPRTPGNCDF